MSLTRTCKFRVKKSNARDESPLTERCNWKFVNFPDKRGNIGVGEVGGRTKAKVEDQAWLFTTIYPGGSTCKFASMYNRNKRDETAKETFDPWNCSNARRKRKQKKKINKKIKNKRETRGRSISLEGNGNESNKTALAQFPWNRLKCFSTFVRAYRDRRQKNELVCSPKRNQKEKRLFIRFQLRWIKETIAWRERGGREGETYTYRILRG